MTRKALTLALFAALVAVSTAALFAQERKPGDRVVYDMTFAGAGPGMGTGTMAMTLTVTIGSVNPDGTAKAHVAMTGAMMPRGSGFDATLTPTGAIVPAYDPAMKPHAGMNTAAAQKMSQNAAAEGFAMNLGPMNSFADACAKRGVMRVGDSWSADMQAPFPVAADFTVTGQQTLSGHSVFIVSVKGVPAAGAAVPGLGAAVSGQGTYDTAAHLVAALHLTVSNGQGQSQTTDITLKP